MSQFSPLFLSSPEGGSLLSECNQSQCSFNLFQDQQEEPSIFYRSVLTLDSQFTWANLDEGFLENHDQILEQEVQNFFNTPQTRDQEFSAVPRELEQVKSKKIIKKGYGLATRNIRANFGTSLVHFIEFLIEMRKFSRIKQRKNYEKILEWLKRNSREFRSFEGWRQLWNHQTYGRDLRKISKLFFGNDFAQIYVRFSRVKKNYKDKYLEKIPLFVQGARIPKSFRPCNFKSGV